MMPSVHILWNKKWIVSSILVNTAPRMTKEHTLNSDPAMPYIIGRW